MPTKIHDRSLHLYYCYILYVYTLAEKWAVSTCFLLMPCQTGLDWPDVRQLLGVLGVKSFSIVLVFLCLTGAPIFTCRKTLSDNTTLP
jgi:hypothetical protein